MAGFKDEVERIAALNALGQSVAAEAQRAIEVPASSAVPQTMSLLRECASHLSGKKAPEKYELPGSKLWSPKRSPEGYALYHRRSEKGGLLSLSILTPDGRFWAQQHTPLIGSKNHGDFIPITVQALLGRKLTVGWEQSIGFDFDGTPTVVTKGTFGDSDSSLPLSRWLAEFASI